MNKIFLLFFAVLLLTPNFSLVAAQDTEYESFEQSPIQYWHIEGLDAQYYQNNTVIVTLENITWFNEDWGYRKQINIVGSNGAGTNYTLRLKIWNTEGTDCSPHRYDIYCNEIQDDFDDLRFTSKDGFSQLYYHVFNEDTSYQEIYVNVGDSLNSDTFIFVYYGNVAASVSEFLDGYNTYVTYDDFEAESGYILGSDPNVSYGWDSFSNGVYVVSSPYSGIGQSLKFDCSNISGSEYARIVHTQTNVLYYWDFAQSKEGLRAGYVHLNDEDSSPFRLSVTYDDCYYRDSEDFFNDYLPNAQNTFSEDTWYNFTMIPISADSYDMVIDGVSHIGEAHSADYSENGIVSWYTYLYNTNGYDVDFYVNTIWARKYIPSEPYVNYVGLSTDNSGFIEVPVTNGDLTISQMCELETVSNNESLTFQINTALGLDSNFITQINSTERLRIELSVKKTINVYRWTVYDENQVRLWRVQESTIISKAITYMRITFHNVTTSSKLTIFYMTGNINYDYELGFEVDETTKADVYTSSPFSAIAEINNNGGFDVLDVSYSKDFSYFQFFRTYINLDFIHNTNLYMLSTSGCFSNITFNIGEYQIIVSIEYQYDDSVGVTSYIKSNIYVYYNNILEKQLLNDAGIYTPDIMTTDYQTISKVTVWRTQEDYIGIAYSGDSELFTDWLTPVPNPDEMQIYICENSPSNYSGDITISHYLRMWCTAQTNLRFGLSQCEYVFFSNFGIVQPHFSSTWFDMLIGFFLNPIGGIQNFAGAFSTLLLGGESGLLSGFDFSAIFDTLGNIGDAIANAFSPIIEGIQEFFSPLFEAISNAVTDILSNVAGFIITWFSDALDWLINTGIAGVVSSIYTIITWFIDGIGTILGIDGLSGIIADMLVNFATSVLMFIQYVTTIFSYIYGGILFMFDLFTTYGPMILSLVGVGVLLHVVGAIVSMNDKIIADMISFYVGIMNKFMEICFSIANMIIQFIGGIIP